MGMDQFEIQDLYIEKRKVVEYLLNPDHPDGGSKARLFIKHGFKASEWHNFAKVVKEHALLNPVVSYQENQFGIKYVVEGVIDTPISKKLLIRSVWMIRIK